MGGVGRRVKGESHMDYVRGWNPRHIGEFRLANGGVVTVWGYLTARRQLTVMIEVRNAAGSCEGIEGVEVTVPATTRSRRGDGAARRPRREAA
jgi:hypothetical protein